MNLLLEFRKQFSLREWLCAMKQGVVELRPQINLKEWIAAFLFYVPTAGKSTPKAGAKLTQQGEQLSFNERFNYLKQLKYEKV